MAFENIVADVDEGVVTLTVSRPKALNALNTATLLELEGALATYRNPATVRTLILTGSGEKAFVAGADIAEMSAYDAVQGRAFSSLGHRILGALESLPIPTIAAVNGFALGGGMELALACDIILASENAQFGQPEVGLGLIPGFGGTQRLTRLVGKQAAKWLIFTGERIGARRAHELGVCLECLPPGELMPRAKAIAKTIATKSPLAVGEAKRCIEMGYDVPLITANSLEAQTFGLLFDTADAKEGMKAFLEKRAPNFGTR